MIKLYPHQSEVVDKARAALRIHNSVLIQAATGFGKTVVAAKMAQTVASKNKVVWFICHRRELIEQTAKTFDKSSIKYSYVVSGCGYVPRSNVYICSVDSLKNSFHRLEHPDLCIWDEGQHVAAAGWAKIKELLPDAKHIGLSATPSRLDGSGLGEHFQHMIHGPSVKWLIENNYLSRFKLYAPSQPDLSSVPVRYGDYKKPELERAMTRPVITGDIVKHWKKHARDKKTLLFACTVEHSKMMAERFRAAGVMAVHLDGKTPNRERAMACDGFARGDIYILCNVDLFGEGFDIAAQAGIDITVEAVIQARATYSLSLHLQQVGRALRPKKNPAIILDHAGNCLRHGFPDDDRTWSLDGDTKGSELFDQDQISIKQCPKCFLVHRPSPSCPSCGFVYIIKHRVIEEVDGELVEIEKKDLPEKGLQFLIRYARKKRYKDPIRWAAKVWTRRQESKKRARIKQIQ